MHIEKIFLQSTFKGAKDATERNIKKGTSPKRGNEATIPPGRLLLQYLLPGYFYKIRVSRRCKMEEGMGENL